ncbi:MAG: GntR family transcriptional regulator [Sarcina sp.]
MSKALKIASDIERKIHKGTYKEGDKLPTEMQLCDQYEVSRMTIRKALEKLIDNGWLYRIQGSGNYVKKDVRRKAYSGDTKTFGLTKYLKNSTIRSEMLDFKIIAADEELAKKLYCKEYDIIYYVERLRVVDGEPYVLEYSYFLEKYVKGLSEKIIKSSIYRYVEEDLNHKIQQSTNEVRAEIADTKLSNVLQVKEGSALLVNESTVYLDNGQAFEHSIDYHVGAKEKFLVIRNRY